MVGFRFVARVFDAFRRLARAINYPSFRNGRLPLFCEHRVRRPTARLGMISDDAVGGPQSHVEVNWESRRKDLASCGVYKDFRALGFFSVAGQPDMIVFVAQPLAGQCTLYMHEMAHTSEYHAGQNKLGRFCVTGRGDHEAQQGERHTARTACMATFSPQVLSQSMRERACINRQVIASGAAIAPSFASRALRTIFRSQFGR
jgi:hypothetical protein